MTGREPLRLQLKLDGPLVADNRLPLSELVRVTQQLRGALRDVATVLSGHGPSRRTGRVTRVIEESTDLRIVAAPRAGSFALELEAPPAAPEQQEDLPTDMGPALTERSVEAFVAGLELLSDEGDALPAGYDRGVLRSLLPFRTALQKGVNGITLTATRASSAPQRATIDSAKIDTAARLIKKPVRAPASAEGMLLMVDFGSLECRIDRPPRPSVSCFFDEKDRDVVHQAVRQFVRVVGEGQYEPDSAEPSRIWAAEITVLETLGFDPAAFWQERELPQLADEQGARPYRHPSDAESDPWRDDDAAAELIDAISR